MKEIENTTANAPAVAFFRPFLVCTPETFSPSIAFYQRLGCKLLWKNDTGAEFGFGSGDQRFLVTLHHGLVPTRVGVFHLEVENVDAWHNHIESLNLPALFPGVRYSSPEITEWGWRLFYVWDPAGTLLHIGKPETKT